MGTDRLVIIRTDGNGQIASGHLVRCVSVASACVQRGMEVRFLVSDKESMDLLEALTELPVICLQTALYNHLEQELPEVCELLSSAACGTSVPEKSVIFLLDSYYVTEDYLSTISSINPTVKTVYLDDLQLFDYPVDLLVNYDVIPDTRLSAYQAAYQRSDQLLLGALYTPLREQFQNREIVVREAACDVLITTGGSDPYHFCLELAKWLCTFSSDYSGITFHIVIGKLNTDREALSALSEKNDFLMLHENVSDMASLMEQCDLAVSASGTTLYELCALGVPTISFTMADNQLTAAKAFEEADAIPCAGDLRTDYETVIENVMDFLKSLLVASDVSLAKRKSAHENMHRLVDGNGALRIADAIMKL